MSSFLVVEEKKDKAPSSIVPRVEENYGTFIVTADLDPIAQPIIADPAAKSCRYNSNRPTCNWSSCSSAYDGGRKMSRDEFEQLNQDAVVVPKKKMTFEKFMQQFNTLDPNNYGSWPLSVKITCWIFIIILVGFWAISWRLKVRLKRFPVPMHKNKIC